MVRVYGSTISKATENDSLIRAYHNDGESHLEEGRQLKIAVVHQNDLITDEEPTLRNGGGVFLIFLITIAILGVLTFSGADVVVGKFISSLAFESDTDQLENKSDADFGGRIRKLLNS